MSKKEKLKKYRKNLAELQDIYARDVATSHHEPHQTLAMMQMLERQIHDLENTTEEGEGIEVLLRSQEGVSRKFIVVNDNPNPLEGRISVESIIGKRLLEIEAGAEIEIGNMKFKVIRKESVEI